MPIFTKLSREEVQELLAKERGTTRKKELKALMRSLEVGESATVDAPVGRLRRVAASLHEHEALGFRVIEEEGTVRVQRHA